MTSSASPVSVDVDLEAKGKHFGHIRVPHSTHESAYGFIAIPVAVVKGGSGPDVLLTAGNHGDEYEGQIALLKLMRSLSAEAVRGRVIIIPQLNLPAAAGGRRTSPLDEGNLNRLFPGDPLGSPTAQIAHFVDTVLLPMTQVSLDLHSGGSSLEYLPCVYATVSPDPARQARLQAAIAAFGAPLALMAQQEISSRSLMACARAHGHLHFATELGGAGTTTPATQAIADQGVQRLLAHLGVIDPMPPPPGTTRMMRISGPSQYVYAPVRGLFEPAFALGDTVQAGQIAGCIHFPEEPQRPPHELVFADSGMVVCRRVPSQVAPGDCVAHLAADF